MGRRMWRSDSNASHGSIPCRKHKRLRRYCVRAARRQLENRNVVRQRSDARAPQKGDAEKLRGRDQLVYRTRVSMLKSCTAKTPLKLLTFIWESRALNSSGRASLVGHPGFLPTARHYFQFFFADESKGAGFGVLD